MTVYVRKPKATTIHIRVPDGDTTRCSERFHTSEWEVVVPEDRDWQNICPNCARRPVPEHRSALSAGWVARAKLDKTLRYIDVRRLKGQTSADGVGHPRGPEDKPKVTGIAGPACPECRQPMVLRTAKKGKHIGEKFWGCSAFPDCMAILPYDPDAPAPKTSHHTTEELDSTDPPDSPSRRS